VIVGRILVVTSVIQYFVAVHSPFACKPLMEFFVEDWLFRELIGEIVFSRNLVRGLLRVDCVLNIDVVRVAWWCTERSHLMLSCKK
jgi:hypothetical protein